MQRINSKPFRMPMKRWEILKNVLSMIWEAKTFMALVALEANMEEPGVASSVGRTSRHFFNLRKVVAIHLEILEGEVVSIPSLICLTMMDKVSNRFDKMQL